MSASFRWRGVRRQNRVGVYRAVSPLPEKPSILVRLWVHDWIMRYAAEQGVPGQAVVDMLLADLPEKPRRARDRMTREARKARR